MIFEKILLTYMTERGISRKTLKWTRSLLGGKETNLKFWNSRIPRPPTAAWMVQESDCLKGDRMVKMQLSEKMCICAKEGIFV